MSCLLYSILDEPADRSTVSPQDPPYQLLESAKGKLSHTAIRFLEQLHFCGLLAFLSNWLNFSSGNIHLFDDDGMNFLHKLFFEPYDQEKEPEGVLEFPHGPCHTQVLSVLISIHQCNLNLPSMLDDSPTALALAVSRGYAQCALRLMNYGASPNRLDAKGRTIFHCAVQGDIFCPLIDFDNQRVRMINFFVLSKPSLQEFANTTDEEGITPLVMSVSPEYARHGMAWPLIQCGCDPSVTSPSGSSILMLAAASDYKFLIGDLIDAYLNTGLSLQETDDQGRTVAHYIQSFQWLNALLQSEYEFNLDLQDHHGFSPLHICSTPSLVQAFCRQGVKTIHTDNTGKTAVTIYYNNWAVCAVRQHQWWMDPWGNMIKAILRHSDPIYTYDEERKWKAIHFLFQIEGSFELFGLLLGLNQQHRLLKMHLMDEADFAGVTPLLTMLGNNRAAMIDKASCLYCYIQYHNLGVAQSSDLSFS